MLCFPCSACSFDAVCVCACVCVVSVIVKRPVLPLCVVDGRSRNPLYYYYYYIAGIISGFVRKKSVNFERIFLDAPCKHIHSITVTMTESIILHTALRLVMLHSCSWRSQGLHWLQTQGIYGNSFVSQINVVTGTSWLKTTNAHFLDTQIHTSNKRTFANTAQMMMQLRLEALHSSDCMMIS